MTKRLQEIVKYTKAELDSFVATPGSCVHKINANRHYALDPYVLSDLKKSLPAYILKHEISYYDPKLKGVLLAIKNIKVWNGLAALRADDPLLHIDINADCYVFRPETGAELTGIVKHIGKYNVSLVLYRVFQAKINFKERIHKENLELGKELKFRVRDFGLSGIFVTIHGEFLTCAAQDEASPPKKNKKISFEDDDDDSENSENPDSGIEELLNSIKNEPLSEKEFPTTSTKEPEVTPQKLKKVKTESTNDTRDKSKKHKRKSSNDSNDSISEFVKKIKKEKED